MSLFEGTEIMKKTASGVKAQRQIDDGERWLADLIARAKKSPSGVITEVAALTPSRASALLARNPENRPVNVGRVAQFADDIMANRWAFNGETIKVSTNGQLNDGQHRSLAVIECGHPIETLIVVGVARKSRFTNDMGVPRTVGHFLHMNDVKYANLTAAISLNLLTHELGLRFHKSGAVGGGPANKDKKPTKAAILAYARQNSEEIHKAIDVIGMKPPIGSTTRVAFAMILIARSIRAWEPVVGYIKPLIDGDGLVKKSPQHAVRERLIGDKGKINFHDTVEVLLRGWNAYRQNVHPMPRLMVMSNWPTIAR